MALDIPLPTQRPDVDPYQYTPLLLSAIEGFLMQRDLWAAADYDQAVRYMEQLKRYVVDCFGKCSDVSIIQSVGYIDTLLAAKFLGTTLTRTVQTTQLGNGFVEVTAAALGNGLSFPFYARAGMYDFTVLGTKGTNFAIVTGLAGGNINAQVDWYNSVAAVNQIGVYHVDVLTDGEHLFSLQATDKRAASTGYRFTVTSIAFHRTGDLP